MRGRLGLKILLDIFEGTGIQILDSMLTIQAEIESCHSNWFFIAI